MRHAQLQAILERLDRIIELLELQPPQEQGCPHERVTDLGTMGMQPGEKLRCMDCGQIISRREN